MALTHLCAEPGWRIVLADRESEGAIFVPIVGWIADGGEWLPVFCEPYGGASVVSLTESSFRNRGLGILAPGEERESYWDEAAEQLLEVERNG